MQLGSKRVKVFDGPSEEYGEVCLLLQREQIPYTLCEQAVYVPEQHVSIATRIINQMYGISYGGTPLQATVREQSESSPLELTEIDRSVVRYVLDEVSQGAVRRRVSQEDYWSLIREQVETLMVRHQLLDEAFDLLTGEGFEVSYTDDDEPALMVTGRVE